jgi:hypothetical protein
LECYLWRQTKRHRQSGVRIFNNNYTVLQWTLLAKAHRKLQHPQNRNLLAKTRNYKNLLLLSRGAHGNQLLARRDLLLW